MLGKEGGRAGTEGKGQGLKAPLAEAILPAERAVRAELLTEGGWALARRQRPAVEMHAQLWSAGPRAWGKAAALPSGSRQTGRESTPSSAMGGLKPRSCWGRGTQQTLPAGAPAHSGAERPPMLRSEQPEQTWGPGTTREAGEKAEGPKL